MTPNQEKTLKELRKYFRPHEKAFIMASLPFMTTKEIADTLGKTKTKVDSYIKILDEDHIKDRIKQIFSEARLQKWLQGDMPSFKKKKTKRSKKRNVAGIREDLGLYFRSKMEANMARVLNLLYGRKAWEYESMVFELSPGRTGKTTHYLPDFHITTKDEDFWIEVKGRWWDGDITKMRKFLKEYPEHKIKIMTCRKSTKVIEFAEKQGLETIIYEDLRDDYGSKIDSWE